MGGELMEGHLWLFNPNATFSLQKVHLKGQAITNCPNPMKAKPPKGTWDVAGEEQGQGKASEAGGQ